MIDSALLRSGRFEVHIKIGKSLSILIRCM
jgi:hypothetical protein